ncbi:Glucanosyltransferase-domain-containing protein [Phyllosticta citriasiana]|uniref:Glucanosyltransferase-domain-containing protein n=1 Tax=Phyllosticta citriasiana TaxID=595635 RepID=UPI0030FDDFEB
MKFGAAILGASLAALPAFADQTGNNKLQAVTVKGNAFFAGDTRFYVRGIDYQPGGSSNLDDPLANPENCRRDVKYFKELGINVVRIYTVDNSKTHDECMNELADAGIYLALDVNTPKYSINRAEPKESYNDVYLQNVFATIDAFANYTNTLLFFSGNEVINDEKSTGAAPYVKAVTRDMKQYIGSMGYRPIPVGYSAADVESNRYETATYMNCGTDDERSDFFAFNDYSWCNPSSFTQSGWDAKVKQYADYSIPLFLSEYGCNKGTRTFEEVKSLYGTDMIGVYSGGLVYEWSEEGNKYGLVEIEGDKVNPKPDYQALKDALAKTPPPQGDGGYKPNGAPSQCPKKSNTWDIDTDALPAIPEPAKKYMTEGAGTPKGLNGPGSQNAGTESSGTATAGSGKVTATASGRGAASTGGKKTGAAAAVPIPSLETAPFVCSLVVLVSTFLGAAML